MVGSLRDLNARLLVMAIVEVDAVEDGVDDEQKYLSLDILVSIVLRCCIGEYFG